MCSFSRSRPRKSSAAPMSRSPKALVRPPRMKSSGRAMPTMPTATSVSFTEEKPSHAKSRIFTVVPMLAPMSTGTDCRRVSRPALVKLTTITLVTLEYCVITVVMKPVNTPRNRSRVMVSSTRRMRAPATRCRPSLITFMPWMKKPSEPASRRNWTRPNCMGDLPDGCRPKGRRTYCADVRPVLTKPAPDVVPGAPTFAPCSCVRRSA